MSTKGAPAFAGDDDAAAATLSVLAHSTLVNLSPCLDRRLYPSTGTPVLPFDHLPAVPIRLPFSTWDDVLLIAARLRQEEPLTHVSFADKSIPVHAYVHPLIGHTPTTSPSSSASSATPSRSPHLVHPTTVLPITSHAFEGSTDAIRARATAPPANAFLAVVSYVQDASGNIPPEVASAVHAVAATLSSPLAVWLDKIPLGSEREWWAKRAPHLYASNPVILSVPPIPYTDSGPSPSDKFVRSVPQPVRPAAACLRIAFVHLVSCDKCKAAFRSVLRRLYATLQHTLTRITAPNDVARSLAALGDLLGSTGHVHDDVERDLWDCVDPSWIYRVWPRMEVCVGSHSSGVFATPSTIVRLVNAALLKWTLFFLTTRLRTETPTLSAALLLVLHPLYQSLHACLPSTAVAPDIVGSGFHAWNALRIDMSTEAEIALDVKATRAVGWERGYQLLSTLLCNSESAGSSQMFVRGILPLGVRPAQPTVALAYSLPALDALDVNVESMFKPSNVIDWKTNIVSVLYNLNTDEVMDSFGEFLEVWSAAAARSTSECVVWQPIERDRFTAVGWLTGRGVGAAWASFCVEHGIASVEAAHRLNERLLCKAIGFGEFSVARVHDDEPLRMNYGMCAGCMPGLRFEECGTALQLSGGICGVQFKQGCVGKMHGETTWAWWLFERDGGSALLRWTVWQSWREENGAPWEAQCAQDGCDKAVGCFLVHADRESGSRTVLHFVKNGGRGRIAEVVGKVVEEIDVQRG